MHFCWQTDGATNKERSKIKRNLHGDVRLNIKKNTSGVVFTGSHSRHSVRNHHHFVSHLGLGHEVHDLIVDVIHPRCNDYEQGQHHHRGQRHVLQRRERRIHEVLRWTAHIRCKLMQDNNRHSIKLKVNAQHNSGVTQTQTCSLNNFFYPYFLFCFWYWLNHGNQYSLMSFIWIQFVSNTAEVPNVCVNSVVIR